MMYFIKLLFIALSGVDPLVFFAPIYLVLGASLVAALWELEASGHSLAATKQRGALVAQIAGNASSCILRAPR